MTIYNFIAVIGGLAFFLFGMNVLSSGLKKVAGDRIEPVLQKMTDSPMKGLFFGAIITILMQSSSALTVMLVGLVNSGIMSLGQTVGIIMGSNIGTTLTAWILSLSGVETDNFLISMLKPANFSPILALIGVILLMAAKEQKRRDLGSVLVGFAILMQGMDVMSDSLSPLADMPEFTNALVAFENPFFGAFIGMMFTAVIQSSAASVGVLQALSLTGAISYGLAIPIIMGQNIGTCVTVLLSSIGVSKNAKRVSIIHISFNIIGTAIGLIVYLICAWGLQVSILDESISPFAIAAFHSIFNVVTTLIVLPFSKQLVRIAERAISDGEEAETFLDTRLLITPAIAVVECRRKLVIVAEKALHGVLLSMKLLEDYKSGKVDEVKEAEQEVDDMVESCNQFLMQLSEKKLSERESLLLTSMIHDVGDMERISDYSLNLSQLAKRISKSDFSGKEEFLDRLAVLNDRVLEILSLTVDSYIVQDTQMAEDAIELAKQYVADAKKMKKKDLKTLKKGKGEAEASVYLNEYLTITRRLAEHSMNIMENFVS